jgi:acyl phosphate:glycerol-3-phosphate acyltransferase
MDYTSNIILIILISYIIGSLPTAVWLSRGVFGFDIRTQGSGNMGSTNVYRVLGVKWGIVVQLADILKGLIPVIVIVKIILPEMYFIDESLFGSLMIAKIIAGISAVIGHIWSFFVKFKGGKGVNTATGMLLGLAPWDVATAFACFAIVVMVSGYISLGSITGAIAFPSSILIREKIFNIDIIGFEYVFFFSIILGFLVIYTHRSNIKRLLDGSENKFTKLQFLSFKKNKT